VARVRTAAQNGLPSEMTGFQPAEHRFGGSAPAKPPLKVGGAQRVVLNEAASRQPEAEAGTDRLSRS
jgi:hypothetical protein